MWLQGAVLPAVAAGLLFAADGRIAASAAVQPDGSTVGRNARFIDVNGVRTSYYGYGQGEPMVLVHGGGIGGASTRNNWSRNIPGLAKRFHAIALDRLAQGMTSNPKSDEEFANRDSAEHTYQFLQTMRLGKVHLVGHSAGGGVVFQMAVDHPEIARTLTVVARGPGISPPGDDPIEFAAIQAKCPPDPNGYQHRKCRLLALAHSEAKSPPDYEATDEFVGKLPKSVENRKLRGVNYYCRLASTISAGEGPAKEC